VQFHNLEYHVYKKIKKTFFREVQHISS